jgi:hypothetical protein
MVQMQQGSKVVSEKDFLIRLTLIQGITLQHELTMPIRNSAATVSVSSEDDDSDDKPGDTVATQSPAEGDSNAVEDSNDSGDIEEAVVNVDERSDSSDSDTQAATAEPGFWRSSRVKLIGVLFLLLAVVAVVLGTVLPRVFKSGPNESELSTPYATVSLEQEELYTNVTTALEKIGIPTDDFLLKEGHQYKAFDWLSRSENFQEMDEAQWFQRYALATLYFSTNDVPHDYAPNPGPWYSELLWLTDESECEWQHVFCDAEMKVQKLIFQKVNLSGKIPLDVALLRDTLYMLDLTSNSIHMKGEDFMVFDYLHHLKHLYLEDNFVESKNGLPHNIKAMQDLEEFKASYNLMSGPLDNGVLQALQKMSKYQ